MWARRTCGFEALREVRVVPNIPIRDHLARRTHSQRKEAVETVSARARERASEQERDRERERERGGQRGRERERERRQRERWSRDISRGPFGTEIPIRDHLPVCQFCLMKGVWEYNPI